MLLLPVALACFLPDDRGGTAVGNPTGMDGGTGGATAQLTVDTAPASGMHFEAAVGMIDTILVTTCEGDEQEIVVAREVDLLGEDPVLVPADACSVRPRFGSPLLMTGRGPGQSAFSLTLDVGDVEALLDDRGWRADYAIVQLGGKDWTSSAELGLEQGQDVVVTPEDEIHPVLVERIRAGTGLYADDNGNGTCNGEECDGARE